MKFPPGRARRSGPSSGSWPGSERIQSKIKRARLAEFFRWLLFTGYALLLYLLFTLPPEALPEPVLYANDKVLHFLDFFILTLLAFRAFFYSSAPLVSLWAAGKSVLFSLLYGAFLEWAQKGVSGRQATWEDWGADALGTLVASGIFRISRLTRSV